MNPLKGGEQQTYQRRYCLASLNKLTGIMNVRAWPIRVRSEPEVPASFGFHQPRRGCISQPRVEVLRYPGEVDAITRHNAVVFPNPEGVVARVVRSTRRHVLFII
jgi:hypothetical protein